LREAAKLARDSGALVIFDEVQTGFGRTGKLFCYEHFQITPDILTTAKSIANGLPMGAVLAVESVASLFVPGTHATTFGGNFLASAAAHGVLDIMLKDGFFDEVNRKGVLLKTKLADIFGSDSVRGLGLMLGVDLNGKNSDFVNYALNSGVVILSAGSKSIRVYPPLNITDDLLLSGVEKLAEAYEIFQRDER
jgi:acetylornithine/succinyldiaminopimelate/putrescine aminotransferase